MREIFISYKSNDPTLGNNDETIAYDLCKAIESAGLTCWIAPRDIEPGARSYEGAIMRAIKNCEVMLLVFSRFTNNSDDVFKEVANAARRKKQIIPFRIDGSEPNDDFEYHLGSVQWIDARGDYRQKITELIESLQHKLGKPNQITTPKDKKNQAVSIVTSQPKHLEMQIDKETISKEKVSMKSEETVKETFRDNNEVSSIETFIVNGVSFNMVGVEGGVFMMGTEDSYRSSPSHQVTLYSYYIGETQVTQELWQAVMGSNPSSFKDNLQRPVDSVSWIDCQRFIKRLNRMTGKHFRLPTEAEWEYAARGGNRSDDFKYAGSDDLDEVAWNYNNSIVSQKRKWYGAVKYFRSTFPVATKNANELGLFDMSGNVEEWCQDWYEKYDGDAQVDPKGPKSGSERVLRGGSFSSGGWSCEVYYRHEWYPTSSFNDFGLRLALSPFK